MKMFRLLAGTIALLIVGLIVGCSNNSPDFTAELKSVQIKYTVLHPRSSGKIAVGDQLQFTASGLCTTPPGTKAGDPDVVSKSITENGVATTYLLKPCSHSVGNVTWSVDGSGNGTINPGSGLFTAGPGAGNVVVTGTATSSGLAGTASVDTVTLGVTPVVLDHIVVGPKTPAPVAQNGHVDFTVTGVGSDGNAFTITPASVTWTSSCATTVATIAPTSGSVTTTATAVATTGTCTITASVPANTNGDTIAPDAGTFFIDNNVALKSLVSAKLTPPSAAVHVHYDSVTDPSNGTQDYQLMGIYGDGHTYSVPNSAINWTVSAGGFATLADNASDNTKQRATGAKIGLATITATLKDSSTLTDPTKNFATGTLTVVDPKCTAPLSNQGTPAATTFLPPITGGLCLICGVTSADNVIDADPRNAAMLSATLAVGLPTNAISLNVNGNQAAAFQPVPVRVVAFHITDPAGALLSANVLNTQIQIATLDQDGKIVENTPAPYIPGGLVSPLAPLLDVTLLGAGTGPTDGAWVHMLATKAFYGAQVTFSSGLVGALATVNVDTACSDWDGTK